jgi:transcriptional regulator of acetoin/glycerol metabolism
MLLSAAMMTEGASIDVRDLRSSTVDAFSAERPQEERSTHAEAEDSTDEGVEELAAVRDLRADGLEPTDDGRAIAPTPSDLRGFKQRERQRILDALERHGWNRVKAATALGMPRRTFYRRLSEFGIL